MAHGTPDWGFIRQETIHVLSDDLAELAARLGSIHIFDRKGYVILQDNFNNGLASWLPVLDGTNAAVELSTVYPFWPPYCLKLTAGSSGANKAEVRNYLAPVPKGKLGLELRVSFPTAFNTFTIQLTLVENAVWHHARIRLDYTDDKLYYRDATGAYQEVADLVSVVHTVGLYHNLKLVADFSTDGYIQLLFDDTDHDLSEYTFQSFTETATSQLRVFFEFLGREGQNDYCLIDGVIVTQNE